MKRQFAPWRLAEFGPPMREAPSNETWLWDRVRATPTCIAERVLRNDLCIAEVRSTDTPLFDAATTVINAVPDLARVVAGRVGNIHILQAQHGYDVSHSEPLWPDRVFVSSPERYDQVGALRLAESVIHEAMHLHLTIWEGSCPLVRDVGGHVFSPWRQTHRSYGGVLHGLFVFSCLSAFFKACPEPEQPAGARHVHQRVAEIAADLADIDQPALNVGLTSAGRRFVKALLRAGLVDHLIGEERTPNF